MQSGIRWIYGTWSDDTIYGSSGGDVIYGGARNDKILGGKGNYTLVGDTGNDHIQGAAGHDRLFGGDGNDGLYAGAGHDHVNGGNGDDHLTGGIGNDVLVGGAGVDRFFFNPNRAWEGHDVIRDFALGTDKIMLNVADVLASTPGLLALAGNPTGFNPEDLDASPLWKLSASHDGDLVVWHPTAAVEIDGLKFDTHLNFRAILPAIALIA